MNYLEKMNVLYWAMQDWMMWSQFVEISHRVFGRMRNQINFIAGCVWQLQHIIIYHILTQNMSIIVNWRTTTAINASADHKVVYLIQEWIQTNLKVMTWLLLNWSDINYWIMRMLMSQKRRLELHLILTMFLVVKL